MEIYGNPDKQNVFSAGVGFVEAISRLNNYASEVKVFSRYTLDSGVEVVNMVIENYSFRNANFMIIIVNIVDDKQESPKVFLTVKERQEGLINFSMGKRAQIENEIRNLLINP